MDSLPTTEPPFAEIKVRRALAETQPLLDPVSVAMEVLEANAVTAVPLTVLAILLNSLARALEGGASLSDALILTIILVAISYPIVVLSSRAFHKFLILTLRHGAGVPVFYLRAFRSDQQSQELRRSLQVLIGSEHQLTGIRPPARRVGFLYRLVFTIPTGFRYLGSPYFRLEAGHHNW